MESIDENKQVIAIKKVLEEMYKAEEYVKSWNASWWEEKINEYSLYRDYDDEEDEVNMNQKYGAKYKLASAFYSNEGIGTSAIKDGINDNNTFDSESNKEIDVEFEKIIWDSMNSHKCTRQFSFNKNGIIKFSKNHIFGKSQSLQNPKRISYNTSFNVLSNDFDVSITMDQLINDRRQIHKYDYITFALKDNVLVEKFNDIEIMLNLTTGTRLVRISRKYDKWNPQNNTSVLFEAILNPDNSLEMGTAEIKIHKYNGKIKGSYIYDVSKKKGARANYYTRKGVKYDLTNNPMLLNSANEQLLQLKNKNDIDLVSNDLINFTQRSTTKDLSEIITNSDYYDFNMESINQTEKKVIEMIKCIKGELPLSGLVERIDNSLEIIENFNKKTKDEKVKVLKLNHK